MYVLFSVIMYLLVTSVVVRVKEDNKEKEK